MVLAQIYLCLCQLLSCSYSKVQVGLFKILLATNQSVTPDDPESIVAFLLTVHRATFEPHLRNCEVLLYAFPAEIHTPEVSGRCNCIAQSAIFLEFLLGFHSDGQRITWPDLPCDTKKVLTCAYEISGNGTNAFSS